MLHSPRGSPISGLTVKTTPGSSLPIFSLGEELICDVPIKLAEGLFFPSCSFKRSSEEWGDAAPLGGELSWGSAVLFPWHQSKTVAAAAVVALREDTNAFLPLMQQLSPMMCSEGLHLGACSSGWWGSVCCMLQMWILVSFGL